MSNLFDDFLAAPVAFDRSGSGALRQIIARQFDAALQSQHSKNVDLVDALYLLESVTRLTGDVQRAIDWYRYERLAISGQDRGNGARRKAHARFDVVCVLARGRRARARVIGAAQRLTRVCFAARFFSQLSLLLSLAFFLLRSIHKAAGSSRRKNSVDGFGPIWFS